MSNKFAGSAMMMLAVWTGYQWLQKDARLEELKSATASELKGTLTERVAQTDPLMPGYLRAQYVDETVNCVTTIAFKGVTSGDMFMQRLTFGAVKRLDEKIDANFSKEAGENCAKAAAGNVAMTGLGDLFKALSK